MMNHLVQYLAHRFAACKRESSAGSCGRRYGVLDTSEGAAPSGSGRPDRCERREVDDRCSLYHPSRIGGNSRHRYVHVEAVRVYAEGLIGPAAVLREARQRYRRPVVMTEAHIGCSAAQQASWLAYCWDSAQVRRASAAKRR